jgi:hypothetical protein
MQIVWDKAPLMHTGAKNEGRRQIDQATRLMDAIPLCSISEIELRLNLGDEERQYIKQHTEWMSTISIKADMVKHQEKQKDSNFT